MIGYEVFRIVPKLSGDSHRYTKSERTKEKIEILKTIIDEIIILEEYANV